MTTLRKSIIAAAFAAALPGLALAAEPVKAGQGAAVETAKPVIGQQKAEAKGEVKAHSTKMEKDAKAPVAKSETKAHVAPASPAVPAAPAAKQ
jgi:hypothetical protein